LFRGNVPRDPSAPLPSGRIRFEAPPGTVRLLIVAENAKGSRIDHDESAIEVPDFTGAGPIVTAPAVFRGRTARDIQQIRAAADPIPVVTREFPRTDRLLVRFQAYAPGGTTPQLALRLLNNLGKKMSDLPAPTRLPDGTFEVEMGLGSLAQGDYLVEIDAAAGDAHTQSLLPIRVAG
jgi:hypothetical protein